MLSLGELRPETWENWPFDLNSVPNKVKNKLSTQEFAKEPQRPKGMNELSVENWL